MVNIPFIHGLCIKMFIELNAIFGINNSKNFVSDTYENVIVAAIVAPFMSVPLLSIAVAKAYIEVVGENYVNALNIIIQSSNDYQLKNDTYLKQRIKEELEKRNSK
ncbi:MAG: hypothetical protein ACK5LY_07350 [Lachnospirales bacterium]